MAEEKGFVWLAIDRDPPVEMTEAEERQAPHLFGTGWRVQGPSTWSGATGAQRNHFLFVVERLAQPVLEDLMRRALVAGQGEDFFKPWAAQHHLQADWIVTEAREMVGWWRSIIQSRRQKLTEMPRWTLREDPILKRIGWDEFTARVLSGHIFKAVIGVMEWAWWKTDELWRFLRIIRTRHDEKQPWEPGELCWFGVHRNEVIELEEAEHRFTYEHFGWRPFYEDWDSFETRIRRDFDRALLVYREAVETKLTRRGAQQDPQKQKLRPEHFEWAVSFQVLGESTTSIAERTGLSERAVRKAVEELLREIGLEKRRAAPGCKPGRKPRSKKRVNRKHKPTNQSPREVSIFASESEFRKHVCAK